MTKLPRDRRNIKKPTISLLMLRSKHVGAGEFKAHCLQLIDEVRRSGMEIVVTKHRKPVARLVPAQAGSRGFCGSLAGLVTKQKDLVQPIRTTWKLDEPNLA